MFLGVSRAFDSTLDYQVKNQDYFLGKYRNEDEVADPDRDTSTGPSFLSDSVTGRQHSSIVLFFSRY